MADERSHTRVTAPVNDKGRALFPVVAHVLLVRAGRIFLLRRAQTGFMDGWYALPGGHQDGGEGVLEGAARECYEETGAELTDCVPLAVLPYISGRHQGLNFVFEGRAWRGEPGIAEPELFDAADWYDPADLPEPHAPWLADVLEMRARGEWFRELRWP